MKRRIALNEFPEWRVIRHVLSEQTGLSQNELLELVEIEVDSLDVVELVMGIEERFKVKVPLSARGVRSKHVD